MRTDRIINMAKTNITNTKSEKKNCSGLPRALAEKVVTLRVLLLVIFDIAASFLFDYIIHASGPVELNFYNNIRPVLVWVSVALFLLAAAYVIVAKVTKLNTAKHIITPEMIAAMTFIFMAAIVLYNNFRLTPILFYTMMVVISILAAIYYIYTMLFY